MVEQEREAKTSLSVPAHVGIIMDGNGRWAQLRGKKRTYGHRFGSDNVDRIAEYAFNTGVKTLTLYAFSSENWSRPKEEVDELMRLLEVYMKKFMKKIVKNKTALAVSGDVSKLSPKLQKEIEKNVEKSAEYKDHVLNIALNYGGRAEIVRAVNMILDEGKKVTEEEISAHLYTSAYGEPDLIIRTGGEKRLSNFLLFQGAYSELYFTDVLWPDFDEKQFDKAIEDYRMRDRRYGNVK